jgi:hypothetical protein
LALVACGVSHVSNEMNRKSWDVLSVSITLRIISILYMPYYTTQKQKQTKNQNKTKQISLPCVDFEVAGLVGFSVLNTISINGSVSRRRNCK